MRYNNVLYMVILFFLLIFLCIPMLLIFSGCGSNRETIIKDKVLTVKVPEVDMSLKGKIKADSSLKARMEDFFSTLPDTAYVEGSALTIDTTGHVVKADIKFFPNKRKNSETKKPESEFQLKVKHSDLKPRYTDSTIINPKKDDRSPWETIKTVGFIIAVILIGFKIYTIFKK